MTSAEHRIRHIQTELIDCQRARISAHDDGRLTVLTFTGEVDAANIDELSRHAWALVPKDGPLIVDLAGLDFISIAGVRALHAVDSECARTGTTWAVVTGHVVERVLRLVDPDDSLPAVGSVTEALLHVRRIERRRRTLRLVAE
jgi:anti-anti-sigma factor